MWVQSLGHEDSPRRKWHPTPVLSLGAYIHGQRSLVIYSPWCHKELDMTAHLSHMTCFPGQAPEWWACVSLKHLQVIWPNKIYAKAAIPWNWCLVTKSYPTLLCPMDCSLPGSSIHGISQARILKWITIPSSRESSWPRDQTCVSCIAGGLFTIEPPGKPNSME